MAARGRAEALGRRRERARGLFREPTWPRLRLGLAFEVPDEDAHAPLRKATQAGLRHAKKTLPGRGRVRVVGHLKDERGPLSRVTLALDIEAVGLDGGSARAVSEAFARAFVEALPSARRR